MGDARASYPRFKRSGAPPRIELTGNDIEILRCVYRHRFIRADDLYRLFATRSTDKLSRRLVRLYRNHYLDRPIAQVDRYSEGGSKPMVYGLDNRGARFIAESFGYSVTSGDWKARNRTYTRENLDHTLSITRFLVDVELACRKLESIDLIRFEEIVAAAPERTRQLPQPGRWQVPVRWGEASGNVLVIPDAIFGLRRSESDGRMVRSFVFLEIDRGTMTIVPTKQVRESDAFLHRTSILRKLLTYATSHHLQLHKEHLALPATRVLTLTTTHSRAEAMREAANHFVVQPMRIPPGLFLFGTLTDCGDPLATKFMNAAGEMVPLLPDA